MRFLFNCLALAILIISLASCEGKGIDRKLDFSGTESELGDSFGEALAEATPEQQNILLEYRSQVFGKFSLSMLALKVALGDTITAKKEIEEFKRLSKMTVRELVVLYLSTRQDELKSTIPSLEKFLNGKDLLIEKVSIENVDPLEASLDTNSIVISGTLLLRNDSDYFNLGYDHREVDYDHRVGCKLALVLDGKQVEELEELKDCNEFKSIEGNGGKQLIKFTHKVSGAENVKGFFDLANSGQIEKIGFAFGHSKYTLLEIRNKKDSISADYAELTKLKDELAKIAGDLEVMKK